MNLYNITSPEFEKEVNNRPYVILPLGSYEQHGPAATLATDWIIANYIGTRIAKKTGLTLLPGIPFGFSQIHINFKGTITIDEQSYLGFFSSIVECLKHHGIEGLIVINGHGGNNIPLKNYVADNKDFICWINWFEMTENFFFPDDHKSHAGSEELSVLALISEDYIRSNQVENMIPPDEPYKEGDTLLWEKITKNGVHYNADKFSSKMGNEIIEFLILEIEKAIMLFTK